MKKPIMLSIGIYLLILSAILIERVYYKFPLEIQWVFVYSLIYLLPIIFSLFLGYKFNKKNPESKNIFWKMPVYSIIPSILSAIFYTFLTGSFYSGGHPPFVFLLPVVVAISIFVYALISIFLASLVFSQNKFYFYLVNILTIILILAAFFITLSFSIKCGIDGDCRDSELLASIALEKNNAEICEKALESGACGGQLPIFSASNFGTPNCFKSNCYKLLAELKNDPTVCEKINTYNTAGVATYLFSCFRTFADNNKSPECNILNNENSRSACYYTFGKIQNRPELCSKIKPYTNIQDPIQSKIFNEFGTTSNCLDQSTGFLQDY